MAERAYGGTPGGTSGTAAGGTATRTALWLLLGGWFGSWFSFGVLVAPLAFRLLPTTEIAGKLIGPVLTALHLYGAAAGLGLALVTPRPTFGEES